MINDRLDITPDEASAQPATTVVFVDARVADTDTLLQGLDPAAQVVRIDPQADGLAQMAAALQAHRGASAVHVLAHGDAGQLWLGSSFLDTAALQAHADALAQVGAALAPDGDILLYACNLAQGEQGAAFVGALSALTGADVAASDDRTGAGGDWQLEVSSGRIDAASLPAAQALANYEHALATITVTTNADSGAGSLRNAIASATAGDTITFNAAMTVTLSSGQLSITQGITIDGDLDDNGTPDVTVDANHSSRVINVGSGSGNVLLDGLVITHGRVGGSGGSSGNAGGDALGGAIANSGTLTLLHSTVSASKAGGGGGGGAMGLSGSAGGGVTGSAGGTFYTRGGDGGTASNGSISVGGGGGGGGDYFGGSGNGGRGGDAAGGIYNTGTLTILASTVSNNVAAGGGGGGGGGYIFAAAGWGGNGGQAIGAIWNAGGTLRMDSSSYATTATGHAAVGGSGGQGWTGNGSNGSATTRVLTTGAGSTDLNHLADVTPPTASITLADTALTVGETSLVTVTFSEAVTGFSNADLTVPNGTLTAVGSGDGGITWTATYTPTAGVTDSSNAITLDGPGVQDGAGNTGSGTTSSPNFTIDTARPTATLALSDTALRIGDTATLTVTFSEAVTGFSNADLSLANGTLTAVGSSDGGVTWTATFTPTAGVTDATNVVTLDNTGVQDLAGNAGSGSTDSNNYAVSTQALSATLVFGDTALALGETSLLTITFSEAVSGFSNADLTVANGVLSAVSSSDGGVTWTATFTPDAGVQDTSNVVTLDNTGVAAVGSGQPGAGSTDSNNVAIDTLRPTATLALDDTALAIGDTTTLTLSFSEAVTGLTSGDLTVANGTLSGLSSSDGGVTWTATLTPAASTADTSNVVTLDNTGITDLAGNAGSGSTDSGPYAVDTVQPTATLSLDDTALAIGETATLTMSFSEAVTGFTNDDLIVPSGTLGTVSSSDGGITWTATFTPDAGVEDTSNVVTLITTGVQDAAGNHGGGSAASGNYSVDTLRPTATLSLSSASLAGAATATLGLVFSEAVTGLTTADLTAPHGALSGLSSSDGGITWTATFTPDAGVSDASNVITLDNTGVADGAGNTGSGSTDSGNLAIDTRGPQATLVVADTLLTAGETTQVTITFDEPASGFGNADLTVPSGTLSPVSSSDGGVTWTATLTPAANRSDATNVISLAGSGVSDVHGNAGSGTSLSNNYAVATVVAPPPDNPDQPDTQDDVIDGTTVRTRTTRGSDGSTTTVVQVPVVQPDRQDDAGSAHDNLADIPLVHDQQGLVTLSAGVPVGLGLNLSTTSGGAQGLLGRVIACYEDLATPPAQLPAVLQGWAGLQTDLGGIGVHGVGFTGLGSGTLLITGHGPQVLVIDAGSLTGGSTLQLDHVDFAAVVGSARIVGGGGNNVLVGDGSPQFIVLGEGDDQLHGGAGHDTVASRGGNDQLHGDEGNDHVVGGAGNDQLHGGDGDDVLQGGGSDAGRWTFVIDGQGRLHTRQVAADAAIADSGSFDQVGPWAPVAWAEHADPRLAFSFQSSDRLQAVALLHRAATGSLPTLDALNTLSTSAADLHALAQLAVDVLAARHPQAASLPLAQQVRLLADAAWGTGVADAALVDAGVRYLQQGGRWADGLLALVSAPQGRAVATDTTGHVSLAQPLDTGELGWGADTGADRLDGGHGDDRLVGGGGNDWLDGGAGIDTAVFTGRASDYLLQPVDAAGHAQWQIVNQLSGETDTLVDVEWLEIGGELFAPAADLVPLMGVPGA